VEQGVDAENTHDPCLPSGRRFNTESPEKCPILDAIGVSTMFVRIRLRENTVHDDDRRWDDDDRAATTPGCGAGGLLA
jgi:hypothetical protein